MILYEPSMDGETETITRITVPEAERRLGLGVTKKKVAEALKVSRFTLWRWIRDGKIVPRVERAKEAS